MKRPLNGEKRREVGMQLFQECASNWRRQAVSSLSFGEKLPANVYDNTVLWKCKQSERDKTLGITENCQIMSHSIFRLHSYSMRQAIYCTLLDTMPVSCL